MDKRSFSRAVVAEREIFYTLYEGDWAICMALSPYSKERHGALGPNGWGFYDGIAGLSISEEMLNRAAQQYPEVAQAAFRAATFGPPEWWSWAGVRMEEPKGSSRPVSYFR